MSERYLIRVYANWKPWDFGPVCSFCTKSVERVGPQCVYEWENNTMNVVKFLGVVCPTCLDSLVEDGVAGWLDKLEKDGQKFHTELAEGIDSGRAHERNRHAESVKAIESDLAETQKEHIKAMEAICSELADEQVYHIQKMREINDLDAYLQNRYKEQTRLFNFTRETGISVHWDRQNDAPACEFIED